MLSAGSPPRIPSHRRGRSPRPAERSPAGGPGPAPPPPPPLRARASAPSAPLPGPRRPSRPRRGCLCRYSRTLSPSKAGGGRTALSPAPRPGDGLTAGRRFPRCGFTGSGGGACHSRPSEGATRAPSPAGRGRERDGPRGTGATRARIVPTTGEPRREGYVTSARRAGEAGEPLSPPRTAARRPLPSLPTAPPAPSGSGERGRRAPTHRARRVPAAPRLPARASYGQKRDRPPRTRPARAPIGRGRVTPAGRAGGGGARAAAIGRAGRRSLYISLTCGTMFPPTAAAASRACPAAGPPLPSPAPPPPRRTHRQPPRRLPPKPRWLRSPPPAPAARRHRRYPTAGPGRMDWGAAVT